jgi:zinc/manganese transport system permease protein
MSAPGGAAVRLSDRPARAAVWAAVIAVAAIWIGLTVSYVLPSMPPSFSVIAAVSAVFAIAQMPWHNPPWQGRPLPGRAWGRVSGRRN